jgi:hypothetical protein
MLRCKKDKTAHPRAELAFARQRKSHRVNRKPKSTPPHAPMKSITRYSGSMPLQLAFAACLKFLRGRLGRTSATDAQDYGSILARQFPFVQFSRNPCRTNCRCGMWEISVRAASLLALVNVASCFLSRTTNDFVSIKINAF